MRARSGEAFGAGFGGGNEGLEGGLGRCRCRHVVSRGVMPGFWCRWECSLPSGGVRWGLLSSLKIFHRTVRASYTILEKMMSRVKLIFFAQLLCASSLFAQLQFNVARPETVQQRLDRYNRQSRIENNLISSACSLAAHLKSLLSARTSQSRFREMMGLSTIGPECLASSQSLRGPCRIRAPKHTFILVAFTGEALRYGSMFYVEQLSKDQLSKIEVMINLDSLGLGPTKVSASESDPRLVRELGVLANAMKLSLEDIDLDRFEESDERSFIRENVCTVTLHRVTPQTARGLNYTGDHPPLVRFRDYYDT